MPIDACQFYYECEGCNALLQPKPGQCCVFCSYGSVKCPPEQQSSLCRTHGRPRRLLQPNSAGVRHVRKRCTGQFAR